MSSPSSSCSGRTSQAPRSSWTRIPKRVSTSTSPSREPRSRRGDPRRPAGGLAVARPKSRFVCQSCAESFLRWEGQCPACGQWNTLVETVVHEPSRSERAIARGAGIGAAAPAGLAAIADADLLRLPVGIAEFDRVLGGGLVPGSLVLVGGEPGIGKSTLLLQGAAGLARNPAG